MSTVEKKIDYTMKVYYDKLRSCRNGPITWVPTYLCKPTFVTRMYDPLLVAELVVQMRKGASFDMNKALQVSKCDDSYLVIEGNHRCVAARLSGCPFVSVQISDITAEEVSEAAEAIGIANAAVDLSPKEVPILDQVAQVRAVSDMWDRAQEKLPLRNRRKLTAPKARALMFQHSNLDNTKESESGMRVHYLFKTSKRGEYYSGGQKLYRSVDILRKLVSEGKLDGSAWRIGTLRDLSASWVLEEQVFAIAQTWMSEGPPSKNAVIDQKFLNSLDKVAQRAANVVDVDRDAPSDPDPQRIWFYTEAGVVFALHSTEVQRLLNDRQWLDDHTVQFLLHYVVSWPKEAARSVCLLSDYISVDHFLGSNKDFSQFRYHVGALCYWHRVLQQDFMLITLHKKDPNHWGLLVIRGIQSLKTFLERGDDAAQRNFGAYVLDSPPGGNFAQQHGPVCRMLGAWLWTCSDPIRANYEDPQQTALHLEKVLPLEIITVPVQSDGWTCGWRVAFHANIILKDFPNVLDACLVEGRNLQPFIRNCDQEMKKFIAYGRKVTQAAVSYFDIVESRNPPRNMQPKSLFLEEEAESAIPLPSYYTNRDDCPEVQHQARKFLPLVFSAPSSAADPSFTGSGRGMPRQALSAVLEARKEGEKEGGLKRRWGNDAETRSPMGDDVLREDDPSSAISPKRAGRAGKRRAWMGTADSHVVSIQEMAMENALRAENEALREEKTSLIEEFAAKMTALQTEIDNLKKFGADTVRGEAPLPIATGDHIQSLDHVFDVTETLYGYLSRAPAMNMVDNENERVLWEEMRIKAQNFRESMIKFRERRKSRSSK